MNTFPVNHRFHGVLDAQSQPGDLAAYEKLHAMNKLSWLLQQSREAAGKH